MLAPQLSPRPPTMPTNKTPPSSSANLLPLRGPQPESFRNPASSPRHHHRIPEAIRRPTISTAATAKIVRFHSLGGPEVLQLDELPLPEPKAGEIRLRVKAIGLNRAEVMFRRGQYLITPELPSKNGYEASGIIEAIGPDVDPSWLGKTASSVPAFHLNHYGVYGEVAIVPVSAMAEYPAKLSYEEGTSIWMQYVTAWGALVHHAKIAKGDFVIITAASSSVGLAAIEMVKGEGGISIAATRTADKKAELLAFG